MKKVAARIVESVPDMDSKFYADTAVAAVLGLPCLASMIMEGVRSRHD